MHYPSKPNRFFALRHGESEANVRGLIVSKLENGVPQYGLTTVGREQIAHSVQRLKGILGECPPLLIAHSPFLRTTESARIVSTAFPQASLLVDEQLKERDFGLFELLDNSNYEKVWRWDEEGTSYPETGVETREEVATRMLKVLRKILLSSNGSEILLVSHGDPLQLMIAALANSPLAKQHRQQYPAAGEMKTGELREVTLPPDWIKKEL